MNMYFMAIVLPPELNEKILHYKKRMQEKYGCNVSLKSPAHITIVPPFWMDEEKETQLKHELDTLSSATEPFILATNNFSAFKPRTIFIAVAHNAQLEAFKETADVSFRNKSLYGIKIDERAFHPHITIATRDLFKKDFS